MNLLDVYNEKGDYSSQPVCGIFAIAVLSGKSVEDVFSHHKEFFHKKDRWRGRTRWSHLLGHLSDYELEYEELKISKRTRISNFPFEEDTKYLVRVGNHFIVVYNDLYVDQYGVWGYAKSRKQITHVAKMK